MHQTAPGAFSDQQADLAIMEHIRHQIAARTSHFVDDHYLWSPNTRLRTGEWVAVAGDIIEIAVKIALEHVDNIVCRRSAAVIPLIDDRPLLVLLGEIITVK